MKCQPDPERHRDLQQGPHSPWWCLPHHPFLLPLASVLFFHLSLLPYNCHTSPLTLRVLTLLSPTLSINICLSVYLFTLVSRSLLKTTGEPSVPCGCERPLRVGSTAAAGADRPGVLLSCRSSWRHRHSPHHESPTNPNWPICWNAQINVVWSDTDWRFSKVIQRKTMNSLCLTCLHEKRSQYFNCGKGKNNGSLFMHQPFMIVSFLPSVQMDRAFNSPSWQTHITIPQHIISLLCLSPSK